MLCYQYRMIKIPLVLFVFVYSSYSFAGQIKLSDILNHQFQHKEQKKINADKIKFEVLQNQVLYSEWLLDINSSLEKRMDITEILTNRVDNMTSSLPWTTKLKQKTPYGLALNLEYYKELGAANFNNGFQNERYRASLEFSLLKDVLGRESRKVSNANQLSTEVFSKKVKVDLCSDLSKKYIKASALQEKLILIKNALKESKNSLYKLKKAVKRGALHKSSQDSVSIDVSSLKSELIVTQKSLEDALTDLEQSSGIDLDSKSMEALRSPAYSLESSKFYLKVAVLEHEFNKLEAQLSRLKLNRSQDLSLYGGYESVDFAQKTINITGQTKFNFIGLQAQFQFGDSANSNEKDRLRAAANVKKSEIIYTRRALEKKEKSYIESLRDSVASFNDMKSGLSKGVRLEKKAYKNFYNGRIKYFEFFATRNQILSFRKTVIDTKSNFWNMYIDYLNMKGNESKLCKNGGVL